jgi:hypothetical protein
MLERSHHGCGILTGAAKGGICANLFQVLEQSPHKHASALPPYEPLIQSAIVNTAMFSMQSKDAFLVAIPLGGCLAQRIDHCSFVHHHAVCAGACLGEVGSGSPTRTCPNTRIYSASRSYWITQ